MFVKTRQHGGLGCDKLDKASGCPQFQAWRLATAFCSSGDVFCVAFNELCGSWSFDVIVYAVAKVFVVK